MKTLIGGALAASLLALAAPATAADLPQNPIVIESVSSNPTDRIAYVPGVLDVAFRNDAGTAATKVTFLVTDAEGHQTEVSDVGTFSSGVTTRETTDVAQLDDGVKVSVASVELADGSTWTAPAALETLGQDTAVLGGLDASANQKAIE